MSGKRRDKKKVAHSEVRYGDEWRSNDPRDKGRTLIVTSIMRIELIVRRKPRLQPTSIVTLKNLETNRVTQVRLGELTKRFTKVRSGPSHQKTTVPLPAPVPPANP